MSENRFRDLAEKTVTEGERLMDVLSRMEGTEPVSVRDYAAREYLRTGSIVETRNRVNGAGHRLEGRIPGRPRKYDTNDIRDLILESSEPADPAILNQAARLYWRNGRISDRIGG